MGRKVLWNTLLWQRRPGNRKVHKSQGRISFISNPPASGWTMLSRLKTRQPMQHQCLLRASGSQSRDLTTVPSASPTWHAQGMALWAWGLMGDTSAASHRESPHPAKL